jgi:hypothetical protein
MNNMSKIGATTIQVTEYDSVVIGSWVDRYQVKSKEVMVSILCDYAIDNRGTKSLHEYMVKQFPGMW